MTFPTNHSLPSSTVDGSMVDAVAGVPVDVVNGCGRGVADDVVDECSQGVPFDLVHGGARGLLTVDIPVSTWIDYNRSMIF